MIVWIEQELAIAIHDRQIAEHVGGSGMRGAGLLESALARPQQLHAYGDPTPDLADLAASLTHGLARNHPLSTATNAPPQSPAKPSWYSTTLPSRPMIWNCSRSTWPWPKTTSATPNSAPGYVTT